MSSALQNTVEALRLSAIRLLAGRRSVMLNVAVKGHVAFGPHGGLAEGCAFGGQDPDEPLFGGPYCRDILARKCVLDSAEADISVLRAWLDDPYTADPA